MRSRSPWLLALVATACRSAAPVAGGDFELPAAPFEGSAPGVSSAPGDGSAAAPSLPSPAEDAPDEGWGFLVKPYLFASGLDGRVGSDRGMVAIDVDFDELLDSLDVGAMLGFELVPPGSRWKVLADLMYVELEERGTAPGPLATSIDATIEQFIAELSAAYELREDGRLELLAGARYWSLSGELEAGMASADGDEDWIDPLIGARSRLPLGEHFDVMLRADVGGFGVGSEFAYNLGAGVAWSLSRSVQLALGYRHLDVDYDDDVEYDVAQSGPLFGFILAF